jgi:hypothetical protein
VLQSIGGTDTVAAEGHNYLMKKNVSTPPPMAPRSPLHMRHQLQGNGVAGCRQYQLQPSLLPTTRPSGQAAVLPGRGAARRQQGGQPGARKAPSNSAAAAPPPPRPGPCRMSWRCASRRRSRTHASTSGSTPGTSDDAPSPPAGYAASGPMPRQRAPAALCKRAWRRQAGLLHTPRCTAPDPPPGDCTQTGTLAAAAARAGGRTATVV